VGRRLSIDTTFLVDLQRERASGREGAAHALLRGEGGTELCLSTVALGEIAEGFEDPDHPFLEVVRRGHTLLPVDDQVALAYGALARSLRREGRLIGTNDLWIAATSLRHGLPLVTSDAGHFGRIEGLVVVGYR
jgi:tRNA(fMet)-specific endonuclease VapC